MWDSPPFYCFFLLFLVCLGLHTEKEKVSCPSEITFLGVQITLLRRIHLPLEFTKHTSASNLVNDTHVMGGGWLL
jgi:hypothetical protein